MTKLKKYLEKKRIKQREIAQALNIFPSRASTIINGITPMPKKHMQALAEFLNLEISEVEELLTAC